MKQHQWIPSRGKRLSAMIHVPDGLNGAENAPVVICCHGFTGEKVGANQLMLRLAQSIDAAGFYAVRFDFAGSGDSEGEFAEDTTVAGWLEDLGNVIAWVKKQREYSSSPIYLLGHSLGGSIVLLFQDRADVVQGRMALAPVVYPVDNFRDIILGPDQWEKARSGQTISNFYGKGFSLNKDFVEDLEANAYSPLRRIQLSRAPLLILHGTADQAVPLKGSQELYQLYPGEKELWILENVDHVFTNHHAELQGKIVNWLQTKSSSFQ